MSFDYNQSLIGSDLCKKCGVDMPESLKGFLKPLTTHLKSEKTDDVSQGTQNTSRRRE